MNPQTALLLMKVLGLVIAGVKMSREVRERYERYSAKVQQMIEEDRGPTEEEMAELLSESDDLTARIEAAREDPLR